jgi:hypothetical protein
MRRRATTGVVLLPDVFGDVGLTILTHLKMET